MNPLMTAVLKAGLVTPALLQELRRFNPAIALEGPETPTEPVDLESAAQLISDALSSEEYVAIRETDLDIVKTYLASHQTGRLCMEGTQFDISYGITKSGDYIIPWRGESIAALMTDEGTSLVTATSWVMTFRDVRELFFGEQKAFMVCVPVPYTRGNDAF